VEIVRGPGYDKVISDAEDYDTMDLEEEDFNDFLAESWDKWLHEYDPRKAEAN